MIVCGWCGRPTEAKGWETTALTPDAGECRACGHADPAKPWLQRGRQPPAANEGRAAAGRPSLDISEIRQRLRIAGRDLQKELGRSPTQAELSERLEVDVRTIRSWQKVSG
jgi:hypothetical protein